MKLKRLMALTLSLAILGSASAFAAEDNEAASLPTVGEIGVEFISVEGRSAEPASDELLAASSLDEIAAISKANFEADLEASSESAISEVAEILEDYYSATGAATMSDTVSSTEFLAYICMADGLSALNVATANSKSSAAKSAAESAYPSDAGGLQDSYRHFVWNHMMTNSLSKAKARIVSCNYEWVSVLLPYAQSAFEEYLAEGYTTSNAAAKAYSYAYYMREDCYSVCAAGVKYFSAMFYNAAVRDFWNNCYGRAYASDYSYTYSAAFTTAKNAQELINSDSAVTSTHISSVWSWDWYTA